MNERRRCSRCILPDGYPGITFDSNGVCNHCRMFDERVTGRRKERTESDFLEAVRGGRKGNPKYDALVGISGGKDSCYTLHAMVKRYGFKVLAYTFDNGFFSEGAKANIAKVVSKLGVEHRFISIPKDLEDRLYRALIKKRCGDLCIVCSNGVLSGTIDLALREKIYKVVWGLSPSTEPILPFEMLDAYDFTYMSHAAAPEVLKKELYPYRYCSLRSASLATFLHRVRFVFLPEYVEWPENEISTLLKREYDWRDYGQGASHFDCLVNPAMNHFLNQRFGVSKVAEKMSTLVRSGQITREEALEREIREDSFEEPVEAVDALCNRLNITREDLDSYLHGNTVDYRSFKNTAALLQKLSPLFLLTAKLGLTTPSLYYKYRRPKT